MDLLKAYHAEHKTWKVPLEHTVQTPSGFEVKLGRWLAIHRKMQAGDGLKGPRKVAFDAIDPAWAHGPIEASSLEELRGPKGGKRGRPAGDGADGEPRAARGKRDRRKRGGDDAESE
ncbi:hypothetical protein M885DRAFT_520556 [Pelagophyceae sp. CCMP2097]|nr:hypothetical protein M885DRAFT_520556 [Pelagophyceae sp. CCMP2097]